MNRFGIYEGRVIDRNDPEKLGRVKIMLPGVWDSQGDWVRPLGIFDNVDDGTGGRGCWWIPKMNANVAVVFIQGRSDNPKFARYIADCWARPPTSGIPSEAEGNPDIVVLGFGRFAIIVDERMGQESATLFDRLNQTYLKFDIANSNLLIEVAKDFQRNVKGNETATVVGDQSTTVQGKQETNVVGDEERTIGGKLKITVTGDVDLQAGGKVEIKGTGNALLDGSPAIRIGSLASEFVALKTQLKLWCETHTHPVPLVTPGTGAATASPTTMPVPDTAFSTKTKAE